MTTYEEFVALYLWRDWARAERVHEACEGARVALVPGVKMPRGWIDLLTDDPEERARWRHDESHKGR